MDRMPDVLSGRLEQIAYPHIRGRLRDQVLHRDPQFTAGGGKPINGYSKIPLPKHW